MQKYFHCVSSVIIHREQTIVHFPRVSKINSTEQWNERQSKEKKWKDKKIVIGQYRSASMSWKYVLVKFTRCVHNGTQWTVPAGACVHLSSFIYLFFLNGFILFFFLHFFLSLPGDYPWNLFFIYVFKLLKCTRKNLYAFWRSTTDISLGDTHTTNWKILHSKRNKIIRKNK